MYKNRATKPLRGCFSREKQYHTFHKRHVAQLGSAPSWGVGGRRFKSYHADQKSLEKPTTTVGFFMSKICVV